MRRAAAVVVSALLASVLATHPRSGTAEPPADAGAGGDATAGPAACETLQARADGDALKSWMLSEGEVFDELLSKPKSYRIQVLTRKLVRREGAADCLVRRGYRVDREYFYPASAIKIVAAIRALQFATSWNRKARSPELTPDTVIWYRRPEDFERLESTDFAWKGGKSLREILRGTLVVSDNMDFNRLFDLVGYGPLNRGLWQAGLESARLRHRMFSRRTPEEQKWSPAVAIQTGESDDGTPERETIRESRRSSLELPETPAKRMQVGETHTSFLTGEYHEKPMDFGAKNYLSLDDMQRMMIELFHPNMLSGAKFEGLAPHRELLHRLLADHPTADSEDRRDELVRRFSPMLPGVRAVLSANRVAYYNKAGRAYGFHVDNARIVDEKSGDVVFVTAAIYVNQDGEVNDNDYGYEEKSYPFLRGVGRVVARKLLR